VDVRLGLVASRPGASATSRFESIVKNTKVLAARAAAGWKCPLALFAALIALIRTPTRAQAAVAPNQARLPRSDMVAIYRQQVGHGRELAALTRSLTESARGQSKPARKQGSSRRSTLCRRLARPNGA
jgi:hypothetical protein